MKIRNTLMVSHVGLSLLVVILLGTSAIWMLMKLHRESIETTRRGIRGISEIHDKLSGDTITRFGERIVEFQARTVARELEQMLANRNTGDYAALRADVPLRNVATQDILAEDNEKAGYFDLLDNRGVSVLHPNPTVEGKNFGDWKAQYPVMWQLVEKSFTTPEVVGYYDFVDKNNLPKRKFMVLKQVPGTRFILASAVDIDVFFLKAREQIALREKENTVLTVNSLKEGLRSLLRRVAWQGILFCVIVISLALIFSIWFSTYLAAPIQQIRNRFRAMIHGDFGEPAGIVGSEEAKDLARTFNELQQHLSSLLEQVDQSCTQVMATATEITATARQQEASVNEFGAATSQVAAAAKEISATSRELANTISVVGESVDHTAGLADEGRSDLEKMDEIMSRFVSATASVSDKFALVRERTGSISTVVSAISRVADKTNLLSLNAAIEAEKAGEFGLGFSVVAREIRRLADQTALSTLDIEKIVRELQSSVVSGVSEIERFREDIGSGVDALGSIRSQLERIILRVQALPARIDSLAEGIQAQEDGARQITEAMIILDTNASQTIQSVAAFHQVTQDLARSAGIMKREISMFRSDNQIPSGDNL